MPEVAGMYEDFLRNSIKLIDFRELAEDFLAEPWTAEHSVKPGEDAPDEDDE